MKPDPVPAAQTRAFRTRLLSPALALVLAFAPLLPGIAWAQGQGRGTIEGRVLNAANGRYLSRARISVAGTALETFTDNFGFYELIDVPAGPVTLHAAYTGQPTVSLPVTVEAGRTATQDIQFNSLAGPAAKGPIKLNTFTVQADRFKNASEIAINEEKNSVNIKNVIASDAFGDIPEGNVGEFVKYLPGVLITYGGQPYTSGADATAIQIRGFGAEQTAVYVDGVPITSAEPGNLTSAIGLDLLSINNASRVELTKEPTPDMPMDSIGGAINLVSKSAFEYAHPSFDWRIYAIMNSEDLKFFHREPGPGDKETFHTLPGFDFTYAYPLSSKLGFSVTASDSNEFNENRRIQAKYKYDMSKTAASGYKDDAYHPYFDKLQVTDGPRNSFRKAGSFKVDWRPTPSQTLSVNYQLSRYDSVDSARRLELSPDNPEDWGPDFVTGKFGSSQKGDTTVTMLDSKGQTNFGYIRYALDKGPWVILAVASSSVSDSDYRSAANSHFSEVDMNLNNVGQVIFKNIRDGMPGQITVLDKSGNPLDYTRIANYSINGLSSGTFTALAGSAHNKTTDNVYKLDVQRDLNFFPQRLMSLTFKAGFYREELKTEKSGPGVTWGYQYVGPASAFDVTQYQDNVYTNISPGFGLPAMQWVDPYKVYRFYQAHPDYFSSTSDDTSNGTSIAASNWISYVNTQYSIKKTSDSYYAMLTGRFFHNRLSIIAGARKQRDKLVGREPFQVKDFRYLKNSDGTLYRDSAYPNGVDMTKASALSDAALQSRLATAGITFDHVLNLNSLEAAKLQYIPNHQVDQSRSTPTTPSVNVAYDITKNLVARVGWSRTHAVPDFQTGSSYDALGRVQFNESTDPNAFPAGTIVINNPSLKPWTADDWDFALSYYTPTGGSLSVDYWMKKIKDFWITNDVLLDDSNYADVMTSFGLTPDSTYVNWQIQSSTNGIGTATTHGYEFDARQSLGFLGRWGKPFLVFANYSIKKLSQNQNGDQIGPTSNAFGSAGLSFSLKRVSLIVKATHQNTAYANQSFTANYIDSSTGQKLSDKIFEYFPAVTRVDVQFNFQFSRRLGFFIDGRNVLNSKLKMVQYDSLNIWPKYAVPFDTRDTGIQWTMGIRGTF